MTKSQQKIIFGSVSTALLSFALGMSGLCAADVPTFSKVIGPLLANRCTTCHGPARQKNGLRLDSAEAVKKGSDNGPVIIAGDPDKSPIYHRTTLSSSDGDRMPAKGAMLTKQQTDDIRAWILAGAKFD